MNPLQSFPEKVIDYGDKLNHSTLARGLNSFTEPYSFFNPLKEFDTNLALWLDASDPYSLYQDRLGAGSITRISSSGDPVGTWTDKSHNKHQFIATADSYRPTWTLQANNKWEITFDGVDDYFFYTPYVGAFRSQFWTFLHYSKSTVFIVFRPASGSLNVIGNSGNGNYGMEFIINGGNPVYRVWSFSQIQLQLTSNTSLTSDTYGIVTVAVDCLSSTPKSSSLRLNGKTTSSGKSGQPVSVRHTYTFMLGGEGNNLHSKFSGGMAEIIFVSDLLSETKIKQVEKYLSNKWGIALS